MLECVPLTSIVCMRFVCADGTQTVGTREGTGGRDGARAAHTEGGEGDAPQEEGDHTQMQRARDDTQMRHGSSGTDETPSGAYVRALRVERVSDLLS